MMKRLGMFLVIAVLVASLLAVSCSNTPANSDVSKQGQSTFTKLYVIADNPEPAEMVMLQGLQGIIAQSPQATEGIWIDVSDGYRIWLNDLETKYDITLDYTYQDDPWGLVEYFRDYLEGIVLYDKLDQEPRPDSLNVASTLAGILKMLPVDTTLLKEASELSLGEVLDVRGKDEDWCFDNYWDMANHSLVVFQVLSEHNALRDYAAATKAFVFYDNNRAFVRTVFAAVDEGGMVLGWKDRSFPEDELVSLASEHSLVVVPSDCSRNLSILASFDLEVAGLDRTTQAQPEPGIHYVTFIISDGDNVQWQLNDFSTDEQWYGSPLRGSFPMGWTISPSMATLAPTVMQRLYWDATAVDAFIGGVSGRGYYYPAEFPTLEEEVLRLDEALARAGLNTLMIMDTDYNAFSPDYLGPYAALDSVMGAYWAWYDNYSGRGGEILFVDDKPFVSMKYDLWLKNESQHPDPAVREVQNEQERQRIISEIAAGINAGGGYSAISVHPWSMSVSRAKDLIDRLDPYVCVVDPIQFLQLVAADQCLR